MNRGIIVWIALVVIVAIIAYIYTGFNLSPHHTVTTLKTTVGATTTVNGNASVLTTIPRTPPNCATVYITGVKPFSSSNETCSWGGGRLGVWVQAGSAYTAAVSIVGANGNTYLQGSFNYNVTTFYSNVTLPAQLYNISISAGSEPGTGPGPSVIVNRSTTPPAIVYPYIYNSNFDNGQFTGWNVSGNGFGTAPVNISYANAKGCYFGTPWRNFQGQFFATTYTCGTSVSPGNITSSAFRVNPKTPFLNFQIISPQDNSMYVEVLQIVGNNAIPAVIGYFNTYNISLGANVTSTFANVSMPLTTMTNKVVKIRVVAGTLHPQRYMSVGNFELGSLPVTQAGISSQINITR